MSPIRTKMSTTLKRKPRDKPAAHNRPVKRRKSAGDTPRTSAHSPECLTPRQNLTLSNWMTVYSFVNTHPNCNGRSTRRAERGRCKGERTERGQILALIRQGK